MFRCPKCKRVTDPGEKGERIVIARHLHTFPMRLRAHVYRETESVTRGGKVVRKEGRVASRDDPGGVGYQIDKEILVCIPCIPAVRADILAKELALKALEEKNE